MLADILLQKKIFFLSFVHVPKTTAIATAFLSWHMEEWGSILPRCVKQAGNVTLNFEVLTM